MNKMIPGLIAIAALTVASAVHAGILDDLLDAHDVDCDDQWLFSTAYDLQIVDDKHGEPVAVVCYKTEFYCDGTDFASEVTIVPADSEEECSVDE